VLLQLKDVQKAIGAEEILQNISFIIEEKEKAALVGVNGAGKTSVFRLLTGEWAADGGAITKSSSMRVGYLPQLNNSTVVETPVDGSISLYDALDAVFIPLKDMEKNIREMEKDMGSLEGKELEENLSRYDNLINKFKDEGGYEMESRLKGVLRGLGFDEGQWGQSFDTLSGGQRTRALLGRLLLEKSDLLLLDEPTNHLDIDSVAWLEDYLKNFDGAVLLISHDRYFMDKIVTKTIEIENKKSIVYNGNYTYFVTEKATNRALTEKAFKEQQKEIRHHESAIKTIRSFRTEAAIIRAKSREKLLAKIERVDAPTQDPASMRLRLKPSINSGNDVLFAEGLSMGFDGKTLFSDVCFEVRKGDRVALIGANGIGKTTLLKILVNSLAPLGGRVREGVNVRVGYYDQSHAFDGESKKKTIFQEIADTYPRLGQAEIRTTLAAFMFVGDDVFKPISALSGGELGRVQLSKIMLAGANFLVLDEPTNHLDIFSKEILEDALRDFSGTVVYISHDRYFINNTATKVMELTENGIAEYEGNYDYYVEKKSTPAIHEPVVAESSSKDEYLRKKESDAQARKIKSRIAKIEEEIAGLEEKVSECEERLDDDEISRDAKKAQAVFGEKTRLEAMITELFDKWEELQV